MIDKKMFKFRPIDWIKEKTEYIVKYYESSEDILDIGTIDITIVPDSINEAFFEVIHESEINFPEIGTIKEHVKVITDKLTYRPSETHITLRVNDIEEKAIAKYEKEKLKLTAFKFNGNKKKFNFKLPDRIIDNYHLVTVLRAIDFEKKTVDSFSLFNIPNGQFTQVQLKVLEKEKITTSTKTFECHRIELNCITPYPIKQYLLFSIDYPYYFVKSIKNQEVIELINF